ncbi:RnfH family protein [Aquincola sp. MAHUQ-54]|uniref:UPF0125 protein V4F39_18655 n=1 Tax=Aquincola agrisoli TaxID=3119538 RepID=A0AAW9Q7G8_9BURK
MRIELAYSPAADVVDRIALDLPQGATVRQALERSGFAQRHGLVIEDARIGVWGRPATLAQPLRDRDRVEVYRPLQVDPKEARRLRYRGNRVR